MIEVTYHCPYCGALTSLKRDAYLEDKCVTREPLAGWEYASTTEDYESADGVEFVCIGDVSKGDSDPVDTTPADADPDADGCGRTFYLSFVKFDAGQELQPPGSWTEDDPSFDFLRE
jgi:hypothetical protein